MPLRNSWNSRAIRTALVEPCGADAYWFNITAKESGCPLVVTHYTTGFRALTEWKRVPSAIDVVVVSDLLPMLTLVEFTQGARSLHPFAMIVVARGGGMSFVEVAGDASYLKPFTVEAIQEMVLRVTPIPAYRPKGRTADSNVPFSSMSPALFGTTTRVEN